MINLLCKLKDTQFDLFNRRVMKFLKLFQNYDVTWVENLYKKLSDEINCSPRQVNRNHSTVTKKAEPLQNLT